MVWKLSIVGLAALTARAEPAVSGETAVMQMETGEMTNFRKVTPVLLAEDVEACIRFWEGLGMTATMSVPYEDGIGFAAMAAGDVELMYQSFAMSKAQDAGAIEGVRRAVIYLEVRSLGALQDKLSSAPVVVPLRETGHGTRELYVRDPAGNLIGFAETVVAAD
ncbi:MAG: VOC family protein [Parvularcula sp.]|jgi:uncharacterized glyoxalase superfamily protein PhnB|nr:VOC family protein [Parvularcula sp.]